MRDFVATPLAVAFWKLHARPGHPAVLWLVNSPATRFRAATFEVDHPADVTPKVDDLAPGLYTADTCYVKADGGVVGVERYYLLSGRFSLFALSDGLGSAIEAILHG